jgi:flavin-dependent dehydrogenase
VSETARPGGGVDLLIVGGGPAGLATALTARRAGLERVVVLDSRRPPIDKPCGEGLMPDGRALLRTLGVRLAPGHCRPFAGIRYVDGETVADGRFPPAAGGGLGVRRTALHAAMVAAAEAGGVDLRWGTRADGLLPGTLRPAGRADGPAGVETTHGPLTARWVVAADGLHSRLRQWAELDSPIQPRTRQRFGVRRHFRRAPWSDRVEVHWVDGAEAYVTPVADDEVGIAFLVAGDPPEFDTLLARFPALADRLAGTAPASPVQGRGPLARRVRSVARGRLALVGDASGYVDAITGEGLSLAFHQAMALIETLTAPAGGGNPLAAYRRRHRRIGRLPDGLTRLMLSVERRPWLRRRVIAALAANPALFDRILGVHARALPLRALGATALLRFGAHLLRPGASAGSLP